MISLPAVTPRVAEKNQIVRVENVIHLIRGQRVMLDSDLASIYRVTTKQLNQQLRRNAGRFPADFAFQLNAQEFANLRSQLVTSSSRPGNVPSKEHGGRRYRPWAFTEHGAIMLASVLNSDIAVQASVHVVRAFVRLRRIISANAQLAGKLTEIERRLDSHDQALADLFTALRALLSPSNPKQKREIGFHVRERATRYRIAPRKR